MYPGSLGSLAKTLTNDVVAIWTCRALVLGNLAASRPGVLDSDGTSPVGSTVQWDSRVALQRRDRYFERVQAELRSVASGGWAARKYTVRQPEKL